MEVCEFVNFSIAKKLKEKGYPQIKRDTLAMYNEDEELFLLAENLGSEFVYLFEDFDRNDYVAPTISQVLKWFRDKKIHLVVDIEPKGYFFIVNYNITTDFNDKYEFDIYNSWGCYYDYKQAVIAGIEYVLDNLI